MQTIFIYAIQYSGYLCPVKDDEITNFDIIMCFVAIVPQNQQQSICQVCKMNEYAAYMNHMPDGNRLNK